jgi:hypothetical protein
MTKIYTNETPLSVFSYIEFIDVVARRGERPKRPRQEDAPEFSDKIWKLVERCWAQNPDERPDAIAVRDLVAQLSVIISRRPPATPTQPTTLPDVVVSESFVDHPPTKHLALSVVFPTASQPYQRKRWNPSLPPIPPAPTSSLPHRPTFSSTKPSAIQDIAIAEVSVDPLKKPLVQDNISPVKLSMDSQLYQQRRRKAPPTLTLPLISASSVPTPHTPTTRPQGAVSTYSVS